MEAIDQEYLVLFRTITDAAQQLAELREGLLAAQQLAEELYISRECPQAE